MTTALKLIQYEIQPPVLKKIEIRDPLVKEASEIMSLMGWKNLPEDLQKVIAIDMIGFRDELAGLYSTCDRNVMNRRKSVYWWVESYLNGHCTVQTAINSLKISV